MNATGYIIDIVLIGLVVRQMRVRALTAASVVVPVVLVAIAASNYFRSFTLAGNDATLIVVFALIGILLGTLSGLWTQVWRSEQGVLLAKAGGAAAAMWILGMGFRFAFDIWANTSSGGASLRSFSITHHITSSQAWVTALLLMAIGEVLARTSLLQVRRIRSREPVVAASSSGEVA